MQTGNRIGYHPETAQAEIAALAGRYDAAALATENLGKNSKPPSAQASASAAATAEAAVRAATHESHLQRALANLRDAR